MRNPINIAVKFRARREAHRPDHFHIIHHLMTEMQELQQPYQTGGYTMKAIADEFGVHYATVSRIVQKAEK